MAGYIGNKSSVTLVDGYNEAEADAEFVTKTGDTMTGDLNLGANSLSLGANNANSPQILFENSDGVTGDAAFSTYDDGAGTMLVMGSNFYINSSGSETRFNTSEESSAVMLNRNGDLNLLTGGTGATATTRLNINSSGNVGIIKDLNIGNNDSSNPLSKLRFGATQHGAADIRPSDEGAHKVGLDFYTDGTGDVTINPTFAMRIDGSGNVGIGNTTPSDYYADNLVISGNSEGGMTIVGASTNTNYIMFADGTTGNEAYRGYLAYNHPGDYLSFASSGSQRIRVDASGNFLVGKLNGSTASSNTGVVLNPSGTSSINSAQDTNMIFARAGTGTMIVFRANNVTTTGTISVSGSSTTYSTSSDYRLKENVVDLTGASARVNQLNPSRFNFIADETNTLVDGFLAHEVATVVPEAITGTKDAMMDEEYEVTPATGDIYTPATDDVDEVIHSADAEHPETLEDGQQWRETTAAVMGTRSVPDYQGIDQSKLVPLLTAALQEALTEIASLKTRVEALET